MIVRCPSCTTRFDLLASRFDAEGTMIKCSSCGHDWIEGRAIEISRQNVSQLPALIEPAFEPDIEIRRLVDATREAQEAFAVRKKRRRIMAASWFALAMFSGTPLVYALAFPETVVSVAPATLSAYEWMGKTINIYGLEIRQVELQHLLVEGKRVIAVKGEISNVSGSQRKIPWLRFGLKDGSKSEVYSWTLDTKARPLEPGQSTNFVTRIASPPDASNSLEIRFARPDEIGSNTAL
jgi:predicted Zn finger-like uncharacterized protein